MGPVETPDPDGADASAADRLRRRVLWSMPTGLYVLGSRDGERRNLMTCNLAVQVATRPKLVGVAVDVDAVTHGLVEAGGVFALSLLDRADRAVVRRFVKPVDDVRVGPDGSGTMNGVAVVSAVTGAPVLEGAAAYLDCAVRRAVALGSHTWFVGEVVGSGFGPGGEDVEVLRMEDTRMHYGG